VRPSSATPAVVDASALVELLLRGERARQAVADLLDAPVGRFATLPLLAV
jgi:predicted nucleic acid-binding protein